MKFEAFEATEIHHRRNGEYIERFEFKLKAQALKKAYRQDGIYIIRTNLNQKIRVNSGKSMSN